MFQKKISCFYVDFLVVIGQNQIEIDISKILCHFWLSHHDDDVKLPKTSPREIFLFIYHWSTDVRETQGLGIHTIYHVTLSKNDGFTQWAIGNIYLPPLPPPLSKNNIWSSINALLHFSQIGRYAFAGVANIFCL